MDCITPWVLDITLHTGPTLDIAMATTITGIQPDMAVNTRIADMPDTEAGGDDEAVITEAMMVRGGGRGGDHGGAGGGGRGGGRGGGQGGGRGGGQGGHR